MVTKEAESGGRVEIKIFKGIVWVEGMNKIQE